MLTRLPGYVAGWLLIALISLFPVSSAAQIYTLPRADTVGASSFGVAVALEGNIALVGASGERTCEENGGAAYVYERNEEVGTWSRAARLVPSECRENAFFGRSLDVSGNRVIVGASSEFFAREQSNAAYIFERRSDSTWVETARLTAPRRFQEGPFAAGVALDGDRALVTTGGSPDGTYGGAAYFFEYDPEADRWNQVARLTASEGTTHGVLGGSAALDGDRAVVAASTYFERKPGSVYVFERGADGTWSETARIGDVDDFFITLSLEGNRLLIGESQDGRDDSGAAMLYGRSNSGDWIRLARLRPSTPYKSGAFGTAVSLDGDYALVTGYDEQLGQDFNIDRVVYAFRRNGENGRWEQRHVIDIGEVNFGAAIGQDGTTAIISSVAENDAGSAYIVQLR